MPLLIYLKLDFLEAEAAFVQGEINKVSELHTAYC